MYKRIILMLSKKCRKKRADLFWKLMKPTNRDKILDLGSEDGNYFAAIVPYRDNVFIADINNELLERGKKQYGFKTIYLNEDGKIPVPDEYFDIVHCSSVIEHVTVDKNEIKKYKSNEVFKRAAFERQRNFAREIRRISKRYFVQTPNKFFIVESHTWLPIVGMLPRPIVLKLIEVLNTFWVKKTTADWNLLSIKQMRELFPNSEVYKEKSMLFFSKSIICAKNNE